MKVTGIEDVLVQLRALAARSQAAETNASRPEFVAALRSALDAVNATQQRADALARAYQLGEPDVQLHEVVIALQKANISLHATVQVRNKLLAAYHEIMNMQI